MAIDEQTIQDQIDALQAQQPITLPTMARGSPADGTRPGWLGLLGEALGGGQGPGYRLRGQQEDAAGSRALLNFGINMLLASGPQRVKPDLLSAAATGLQGAQQSIGADQQQAQAQAAADYKEKLDQAKFGLSQDHSKIERLKAMIPLLQLQQQIHQLNQPLPPALGGPPTGGPQAAATPGGLPPTPQLAQITVPGGGTINVAAPVADRFQGLVTDLAAEGYVIDPKRSGGYNRRYIAGTTTPSNHASGTAIDVNWTKNPQGGAPGDIPPDLARRLAAKHGLVWGGDWTGKTRDPMHFEVPAQTAAKPAARPMPLPPSADVVPTGVQVSGPAGVATPGPAAPPSPAVAGDVGAIIAGMTGAGADAATLAPGAGGAAPGVAVAQAGPPAAQPPVAPSPAEEFDVYRKQNLRGGPDLTELERAKAIAQWQVRQAGTVAERAKAAADVAAADVKIGEAKTAWQKNEEDRLFKVWDADRTAARTQREKVDEENRKHEQTIALEKLKAENTAKQTVDTAVLNVSSKRLEALQGKATVAQNIIRDSRALETVADQMGDPNALIANNPKLREYLVSLKLPGLVGANMNELQAGQLWDKLTSGFFQDTHVPGSGSQSNIEGEWMMRQFGGLEQTPEDRHTQLAIVRKLAEHRIADSTDATKLFTQKRGDLSELDDKIAQRSKLFDRPPEWKADDPEANIKAQGRYLLRHPRGEPYAAYSASPDGGRTPGELRYWRNEMVKDPTTGKSRLQPVPLLGGSMVAE